VEVWHYDSPVGTGVSPNPSNRVPDVINYAWREYGMRIGLWRLADALEGVGVKATVALGPQAWVLPPFPCPTSLPCPRLGGTCKRKRAPASASERHKWLSE
jgi:hypothetical protein